MIPAAQPIIGDDEREAVDRVLRSGMLAQGPEVKAFEDEFSVHVNGRHCVAVNSGTSALHMAFLAAGIGLGDEVIVPSFSFAATANSVALTGATPVFVDIEEDYFNIDPKAVEAAVTPRTRGPSCRYISMDTRPQWWSFRRFARKTISCSSRTQPRHMPPRFMARRLVHLVLRHRFPSIRRRT